MKYKAIISFAIILSVLLGSDLIFAQKDKNQAIDEIQIKFSGFLKYDAWYNSRKNVEALDGLFSMYPMGEFNDNLGRDINDESSVNMLAITTRLNSTITGPDIFNAKSSVFIESDFSGISGSIYHFRFRHAFVNLKWEKSELLVGRFWHPMFVTEVCPTVMSLNTGVPFQVFNRSPQIRFTQKIKNFKAIGTALYQADYKSTGPNGKSSEYMSYAKLPNLNLRLQHNSKHTVFGVSADYKQLKPYEHVMSPIDSGAIYKSSNTIESVTFMAYSKLNLKNLTFKAEIMQGQNLYEHLLPGGYAVSKVDSLTGERTYTPSNNLYTWGNITYGKNLKVGLFAGYMKNQGFSDNITSEIYSRASNIDYIYRVSPHISYKKKSIQLGLELENTTAAYGTIQTNNKGKVNSSKEITNSRLLFTMFYFF